MEASDIVSDLKRQLHLRLEEMKKMDKERVREEIKQAEKMQKHLEEERRKFEKDHGEAPDIDETRSGRHTFCQVPWL